MQFVVHSNNVSSLHSRFVVRCIRPILFICLHFQWFICHLKFNENDEMMGTDQTYLATAAKIDWQDMTIEAKTADRTQQREIGKKTSWERERELVKQWPDMYCPFRINASLLCLHCCIWAYAITCAQYSPYSWWWL